MLPQPGLREPLRFSRDSAWGFLALCLVVAALAFGWPDLLAQEWNAMFHSGNWLATTDWLLLSLGIFFLFCTLIGAEWRGDLATVIAGMIGGAIIEVWGTRTGLWYYYTGERPPAWILPAWGMSALSNEKLQRMSLLYLPPSLREKIFAPMEESLLTKWAYLALAGALYAFYFWWAWPAISHPFAWVVSALMLGALWGARRYPAYALNLFVMGAFLGILLEIWGTTRHCWNYYDGKTPSPFPICGHGMAALGFWKLKDLGRAIARKF